jgi:putative addiction module killer protein
MLMIEIRRTQVYQDFIDGLRDAEVRIKINARIFRLANGNAGDVAPVGEGISELRLHFGPGYRVYFKQRGKVLIILLCGGDKATQDRDIKCAKQLADDLEE